MKNPDLLLLDEPIEGLAPLIVRNLVEVIREIQKSEVTILLADQNLKFCRKVARRGYILEKGLIQCQGKLKTSVRMRNWLKILGCVKGEAK